VDKLESEPTEMMLLQQNKLRREPHHPVVCGAAQKQRHTSSPQHGDPAILMSSSSI
jgi:hypothetical protein